MFITQNPKDQVITKTDLAKVLSAWDEYPHIVSKGAESNFGEFAKRTEAEWDKRKDDFNDNYFQEAVSEKRREHFVLSENTISVHLSLKT